MDQAHLYLATLALSLGVFALLWPVSLLLRDVSIVDAWWGPGFLGVAAVAWGMGDGGARSTIILILVGAWALRLGGVMLRRRLRHGAEDSRYISVRRSWGRGFWWKSLFIVFILQGVLQWLISLTAAAGALAPPTRIGVIGAAGALLAAAGFLIEAISDAQLDRFKLRARPDQLLTTGLRRHVRHPSYTGEMLFWWGIWLIAAEAGAWWSVVSPLILTFLLTRVSGAPMTGAGLEASKPGYAAWSARTPAFLPRLLRRDRPGGRS
ncbi:DUF1295 domain-containing protein [Pikeienuella sp. HZG-20]|uniref:DUF1295 domain-containing protein n=1 Tax=Paludibacillus litoralis TaxID=3133267 RepID=UPI0030ED4AB6